MQNMNAYKKAGKRELSHAEKTQLIEKHAQLVKIMAYRLVGRMPQHHFVEDLISCGTIGLLEALTSYNPAMEIKFETFAKFRIRGAMIDEMRSRDWLPRSVRSKMREMDNLRRKLSAETGKVPDDQDLAKALGLTLEAYYEHLIDLQPAGMISYDELVGPDLSDRQFLDLLEDRTSPNPDLQLQLKELKGAIIDGLEKLEADEQLVMSLYYYEGLTLKEISEVMQLTESRVSQIHSKAAVRLQFRLDQFRHTLKESEKE